MTILRKTTTSTVVICGKCRKKIKLPKKYVKEIYFGDRRGELDERLVAEYVKPLGWKVTTYTRGPTEGEMEHGCPHYYTIEQVAYRCPDCPEYWAEQFAAATKKQEEWDEFAKSLDPLPLPLLKASELCQR